jgi:hypothetical protein
MKSITVRFPLLAATMAILLSPAWRRSWRSTGELRSCSRRRRPTQKDLRGDRSNRRRRPACGGCLPRTGRVGLGILRVVPPTALGEVASPRLAHGADPASSRRIAGHLRLSQGACRADARPRNLGWPTGRRDAHAQSKPAGDLGTAEVPSPPECAHGRRPCSAPVRTRRSEPALGHGHHRTPHPRGEARQIQVVVATLPCSRDRR